MGKVAPSSPDLARVLSGTFSATGVSPSLDFDGPFNLTISGTFVATLQLERSFDGGDSWVPFTYIDGTSLSWTTAVSTSMEESESGVRYRLNCTSYTSGAVSWRLSQ